MKTVAVIPAHNEEKTIADVVEKTRQYVDSVVVVDEGSTDKIHGIVGLVSAEALYDLIQNW